MSRAFQSRNLGWQGNLLENLWQARRLRTVWGVTIHFVHYRGEKSWIFFLLLSPKAMLWEGIRNASYNSSLLPRAKELRHSGWILWLKPLVLQLWCLPFKTLSAAELRLFIAQSRDCLTTAQANSPQNHIAQDSSRSSPKPSNKIIRGLFPGRSTKHQRKQRAKQGAGG